MPNLTLCFLDCINSLHQCLCLLLCLCHFLIQFPQIFPKSHETTSKFRWSAKHLEFSCSTEILDTETLKFCCSTCFWLKHNCASSCEYHMIIVMLPSGRSRISCRAGCQPHGGHQLPRWLHFEQFCMSKWKNLDPWEGCMLVAPPGSANVTHHFLSNYFWYFPNETIILLLENNFVQSLINIH